MSHGFVLIFTDKPRLGRLDCQVMDASPPALKHFEITEKIIEVFYDVYNELGHGFLESTYAEAMAVALRQAEINAVREVAIPVWFRGAKVEAQLLHYLRATEIEVGLLFNFGVRPQFRRLLFDDERKKIRENPCESVAKASA